MEKLLKINSFFLCREYTDIQVCFCINLARAYDSRIRYYFITIFRLLFEKQNLWHPSRKIRRNTAFSFR